MISKSRKKAPMSASLTRKDLPSTSRSPGWHLQSARPMSPATHTNDHLWPQAMQDQDSNSKPWPMVRCKWKGRWCTENKNRAPIPQTTGVKRYLDRHVSPILTSVHASYYKEHMNSKTLRPSLLVSIFQGFGYRSQYGNRIYRSPPRNEFIGRKISVRSNLSQIVLPKI